MKMQSFLAVFLLFGVAFLAIADTTPMHIDYGKNPSIYAGEDKDVEMKYERVLMHISKALNSVKAEFVMFNSGEAKDLTVGFPGAYPDDMFDFHVTEDGQEKSIQAVTTEDNIHPLSKKPIYWHIWTTHFDAHAEKNIAVKYAVNILTEDQSYYSGLLFDKRGLISKIHGLRVTGYILTTGARWAGPIHRAEIVVELDGIKQDAVKVVQPDGARRVNDKIEWVFQSLKPNEDVVIAFVPND